MLPLFGSQVTTRDVHEELSAGSSAWPVEAYAQGPQWEIICVFRELFS